MNIDAEEYARVASYTTGTQNFEKNRRFSLFNTVAATIYSIRVYDGPLTAAEKAQKEAAAAEEARKIAATNKVQSSSSAAVSAGEVTKDGKTPPEVQPLPPKKEFEYGDDLSLD